MPGHATPPPSAAPEGLTSSLHLPTSPFHEPSESGPGRRTQANGAGCHQTLVFQTCSQCCLPPSWCSAAKVHWAGIATSLAAPTSVGAASERSKGQSAPLPVWNWKWQRSALFTAQVVLEPTVRWRIHAESSGMQTWRNHMECSISHVCVYIYIYHVMIHGIHSSQRVHPRRTNTTCIKIWVSSCQGSNRDLHPPLGSLPDVIVHVSWRFEATGC